MESFAGGGLVEIQQRVLDCSMSTGDLSSLLSPTSAWTTNQPGLALTTPTGDKNRSHKMSIHTGGIDLGTLLVQDMAGNSIHSEYQESNSISQDDHIFVDDNGSHSTNGSGSLSRTMSEADFSRVSKVLDMKGITLDQYDDDKSIVSQITTPDDWSGYNQQRGREVAQVVLRRVKSRSGTTSFLTSREKKNVSVRTPTGDLDFCRAEKERQQFRVRKPRVSTDSSDSSASHRRKRFFARCMNRLRRKRRALLDGLFSSRAAAKATASQRERELRPIGSHGSTDSAESYDSGHFYEESKLSPKSLYIEDDDDSEDEEDSILVRNHSISVSMDSSIRTAEVSVKEKSITSQDPTLKKSNSGENDAAKGNENTNKKKIIRRFAPHPTRKEDKDNDASVSGSTATSNSKKHRPSQVVDSILRQFSSEPTNRTVRRPMTMVARKQPQQESTSSVVARRQPQQHSTSSEPTQKATSRDREPEETLAKILKMGEDGKKYLAIIRRQQVGKEQQSQNMHSKLLVTESNSDDGSSEEKESSIATKNRAKNHRSMGRHLRRI